MRLAFRLISTVVLGIFLLIVVDAYLDTARNVGLYDSGMEDHALLVGRALRPVIVSAWHTSGRRQAMSIMDQANQDQQDVRVRLVSLATTEAVSHPRLPRGVLAPVARGEEMSVKHRDADGVRYRYTYVPIVVGDGVAWAIEISDPLASLDQFVRESVLRTLGLVAVSVLLSGLAIRFLGVHMVGRPLRLLAEKAQRVQLGDLGDPVVLQGHHELGELATALNVMCERLAVAREDLERENAAKVEAIEHVRHADRLRTIGELASGVAHELGTPLNVISGRADLIADSNTPAEQVTEFAKIIKAQSQRMAAIVRQLLEFARRRPAGKIPLDLEETVSHILDVLTPMAREHDATLHFDAADLPTVAANPEQLQQVITNLVVNAMQAMPRGGPIEISLRRGLARPPHDEDRAVGEYVSIRVRDVGEGMSEETRARVFDPFFTTKDIGEGTGLGLSIAYGLVQEHGGWISVRDEPGAGSSFIVYLPLESN